jgi:hypothetical protein
VKTGSQSFGAFVSQRPDIYVFVIAASLHKLSRQLAKLINGVGKLHFQDAATTTHARIVVLDSEKAESSLLAVPIAANTLDAACAIMEGMGQHSDFGFG